MLAAPVRLGLLTARTPMIQPTTLLADALASNLMHNFDRAFGQEHALPLRPAGRGGEIGHRADLAQRRALSYRRAHGARDHRRAGYPARASPPPGRPAGDVDARHPCRAGARHRLCARHLPGRHGHPLRHRRGRRHDRAAAGRVRCVSRPLPCRTLQDLREGAVRSPRARRCRPSGPQHRAELASRCPTTTITWRPIRKRPWSVPRT